MKLLIAGAFGYGNLGDNAVRDAELAFAASRGLTATWAAPADYPVDGYDAVAVGGGGILYDADYEMSPTTAAMSKRQSSQGRKRPSLT